MQPGFLSHSSYRAHLSTLYWRAVCTITRHRALQDLPTHTVLIGGAEWSISYRYDVKIKPQLLWWLHSAVNHWIQVGGKLAGAAHCQCMSEIVKADWLHSKCDANVLRCQYVPINKLSKGARVGRKQLWRRMMRQHNSAWFLFLSWSHISYKNAVTHRIFNGFPTAAEWKYVWEPKACTSLRFNWLFSLFFACLCLCYSRA